MGNINSMDDNSNENEVIGAAKTDGNLSSRRPARHLSGGLGNFSRGRRRKIRASSRRMSALWRVMSVTAAGALLVSGLSAVAFAVNSSTSGGSSAARAADSPDETNLIDSPLTGGFWAATPATSGSTTGSIGQLTQVPAGTGTLPMDYNTLYWAGDSNTGTSDTYTIGSYSDYDSGGNVSDNNQVGDFSLTTQTTGLTNTGMDTLAVDYNNKLFYAWDQNGAGTVGPITGAGGTTAATPPSGNYTPIWAFSATPSGAASSTIQPNKVLFVPRPIYGAEVGAGIDNTVAEQFANTWAGGEVAQDSGFIYLSGGNSSLFNSQYEMMIVNPADGKWNISGTIQPAPGAQLLSATSKVSSDITIDAAGDAYMIVTNGPAVQPPGGGPAVQTSYLVRVVPGAPGDWTYSLVTPLWYFGNVGGLQDYQETNDVNAYGLGFLNGSLYANFQGTFPNGVSSLSQGVLEKIDPLTGIITTVPGAQASVNPLVTDLGSPQSAAVLTGTVYNDANKNGQQDAGEAGVRGETVQLYTDATDDGTNVPGDITVLGQQTTNGLGQYSFLVPSSASGVNYYVRVVQPVVNGANAVQTGVTTSSLTTNGNKVQVYVDGQLAATSTPPKTPYVDPSVLQVSLPSGGYPAGSGNLSDFVNYVKVTVTTDDDVTTANFGVSSQGSYGDAATQYNATIAQNGPQHVENLGPQGLSGEDVFLGKNPGDYSDGSNTVGAHIGTDDGVTLPIGGSGGQTISPQGQLFAVRTPYTLNYTLSGTEATSNSANVFAWIPSTPGASNNGFDQAGVSGTSNGTGSTSGTLTLSTTSPTTTLGGGQVQADYVRVDASTNPLITANTPDNSTQVYAPGQGSMASDSRTWTSDGETEDYLVGVTNAVVRLQVASDDLGTTKSPIQYIYGLSNISTSASSDGSVVSQNTDTISSTGPGTVVSTTPHAVNATNTDVVVTPTTTPTGEILRSATLVNTITGAPITGAGAATVVNGAITIPGADTTIGSDVTLQLTYSQDPSATTSYWNMVPTSIPDDATTASLVTVTLNSAAGTPVAGGTVTIKAVNPDGTPATGLKVGTDGTANGDGTITAKDNGDGTYTVSLVSSKVGDYTITASTTDSAGDPINIGVEDSAKAAPASPVVYPQTLTVTPGAPVAGESSFSVSSTPVPVSEAGVAGAGVPVTVNTADESGAATSGTVTLKVDSPAVFPNGTQTEDLTTGDGTGGSTLGVGTIYVTSKVPGPYTVTATMGGDTVNATGYNSTPPAPQDTATFTAGPADATQSSWAISPSSVPADGSATATGTVTVTDQFGNPLTGQSITVDVPPYTTAVDAKGNILSNGTASANGANSTAIQVVIITGTDGTATIDYSSEKAGKYSLGAYLSDGTQIGTVQSLQFTAGAAAAIGSTFSVDPTNTAANGTTGVLVTVTTADANGNPVAGTMTLTVDQKGGSQPVFTSGNDGAPNTIDVPTNASGTGTAYITSTVAGDFAVSATVGTGADNKVPTPANSVAHFVAGPPVVQGTQFSTYTFDTTSAPDDGTTPITGTILLVDANHNPVSGATVSVSVPAVSGLVVKDGNTGATLVPDANGLVTVITAPDGTAPVEFISSNAGSGTTNAYVGSPSTAVLSPAQTLTFTAGPPSAAKSSWSVAPSANQVVGTGSFTVTVNLADKAGAPVTGEASSIVLNSAQSGLDKFPAFTDQGNGTYTTTVTSTVAGSYDLTVSIPDGQITAPDATHPVTFIAGAVSLPDSTFSVSQGTVLAGSGYQTALVTITDQYGNPISNVPVTFSAAAGAANGKTATLTATSSTDANGAVLTDANGHASEQVTADTADSYPITALVNGVKVGGGATGSANPQDAVFSAGLPSAATVSIDSSNPVPASDSSGKGHTVSVLVTDAAGNPVAGVPVDFSAGVGASTQSTSAVLSTASATTNAAGIATTTVTATKADTYPVTASTTEKGVTFTPANGTVQAVFGPGAFDASKSSVTVDTATVVADGTATHTITATVTDSYGNPISNESVVFGVADGHATLATPSTRTTGADGKAVITATDTVAEVAHVTATVDGTGLTGSPAAVPFTGGTPVAANSSVSASPSKQTADGTSAITLTATIRDANNNVLANVPVTFGVNGSAALSDSGATTDGNGVATVTVTDTKAEEVTYTATITTGGQTTPTTGSGSITGSGQTVTFVAGAADPGTSQLTIDTNTATANGTDTHTVTATIKDANNNPVANQSVTFSIVPGSGVGSLTGSGSPAQNYTTTTDDNGVATVPVVSTAVGSVQIAATIPVAQAGGSPLATAISGSPVTATFVRENPATGDSGTYSSTLAVDNSNYVSVDGGEHIVTATVVGESTGALLGGVPVTFTAPAGTVLNDNGQSAVVTTASDGTAQVTVTSTTPGQIPIKATVTVGGQAEPLNPVSVNANFAAGAPDNDSNGNFSTVTISSGPKIADGSDFYTVTATLKDQYGNAVPNATVTFTPSTTTGVTVTPTSKTTDNSGVATATVTATVAGSVTIFVDDSVGSIPGSPLTAVFTAGNVASGTLAIDSSDAVVADGSASHTITATVQDSGSNPVVGAAVTFTAPAGLTLSQNGTALKGTPGAGTNVVYTATSGVGGTVVLTASTTTAGSYPVSASSSASGGATVNFTGSPVTAVFEAGAADPNAKTSTWVVTPGGTVPGDGSTPYTATATVTDANGNPINGQTVLVDVPAGVTASSGGKPLAVTDGQASVITGPGGTAVVQYSSTKPGKYPVGAYLPEANGATTQIGSNATLEFVTTAPVADNSSWTVTPNTTQTADGKSAFTATVTLEDANNNLVTGQAKNLSITSDSTTGLTVSDFKDNNDGTYTATITSTNATTYKLSAYLNGTEQIGGTQPVTFVAGPYSANASTLVVTNASVLANNKDTQTATATITDANGNPLAGQTVTFTVGAGKNDGKSAAGLTSATQTAPTDSITATTGADGIATVSVQASYADSYPVSAFVGNSQVSGSPANATFLAGVPSLGTLKIDSATGVTADGTTTHTVTATVTDADGNPLSGVNVNFTADKGATVVAGDPAATSASAQTNASGVVTAYVSSTTAGSYTVTAAAGTAPATVTFSPGSVNALFVAGPPSPGPGPSGKSTLTIDSNTVLADGTQYHTVTATVLDANGNAIANQPVYFTVTNGSAQLSTASGLTNADGVITTQVTSTTAGNATIAATLGSATGTNVDTPVVATFTATAPSPNTSTFEVTTTGAVADGVAQNSATVTIEDAQGHPIAGVPLAFSITGGSDITQLPTFTTAPTTDASGQYVLSLTSKTAGTVTLSASYSVGGTSTTIKGQPQLTFVAGPVVPGSSTISVDTNTVLANGTDTHTVTVTALDANGNLVSGAPVQFTIAGGTAAASATLSSTSPVNTGTSGTAVVKVSSTAVGTVQVGATIGGTAVGSGPVSMSFVAGVPFTGNSTLAVDSPDGVTANGTATHTITATAKDSSGDPLAGEVVTFSAPQGTLSNATATTDANGVARVAITSTTAVSIPVTATVTSGGQTVVFTPVSVNALFVAGPVDGSSNNTSTLTISNGPKVANGTDTYTVTATLKDANGNVIPNQLVNFNGSTNAILSNGTATPGQTTTATTNSSGVATITVASNVVGASTVSASAQGVALFGSPVTAQFTAGAVDLSKSTLTIDNSTAVVADGTASHTITATVEDANGAPIAGATVNFVNSGGTLSASSGLTNASGQLVVTITSKTPGSFTVSGSVVGTTGSLTGSPVTANFAAGEPSVGPNGTSTLTVTQGSVLSDGKATQSATATILDANNNQVPGQSVVFTVGAPAQFSNGTQTITASTGATDGAPVVVTITSTQAGTFPVTATLGGVALKGSPASVSFASNGVADPATSTFTVSPAGPILANGTAAYTATVTAKDSSGSPVAGQVINFTVVAGLTGPTQATTNASGVATASYTSTTAATYPLTASIGSSPIGTKNLAFVAGARPAPPVVNPTDGSEVTGSAEPGSTVQVKDPNGNVLCTTTANATTGAFTCSPLNPRPGDGEQLQVTATNPNGESDPTPVTVQPTAPVISTPANGSTVTTPTTPISGTADPGTTVTVVDETGRVVCTATTSTGGTWSCTSATFTAGQHTLTATAKDPSGNVSQPSAPDTFTVQLTPLKVITPATGSTTANQTPTFSGVGTPGDPIQITSGGTTVCTTTVSSTGTWSCTLPTQPTGTITYTVTDTVTKESVPVTLTIIAVDRIQGPDRYSTAAAAAATAFPNGASTVIVAKGTNFPDAMSAVPAANHLNAPILLTQTPNVPASTMNELNALHPSKIIVLGDTVSVSTAAFNQMAGGVTSKPTMVRIGGIDRYATSRMLDQYVWGKSSTIFVSTGQSFTDADAAGPAAAKSDVPLLLVNGNLSMDAATANFIRSFGVSTIHAVGNTTTLGTAVYNGISGLAATDRTSGTDADQTAVAVARTFWSTSNQVFVARDDDFADSLTGGAAAAQAGAPVLLTNTQSLSPNVASEIISLKATQVHVMGDPNSITASTYSALVSALSQ